MHESMIPQELPTFILDDDGDFISCVGTTAAIAIGKRSRISHWLVHPALGASPTQAAISPTSLSIVRAISHRSKMIALAPESLSSAFF
jgi:hypothetical protein